MSTRTDQVNLNLNVNSNESLNRLNELRKTSAKLGDEMKGLKKSTAEYISKNAELKTVNKDMDNLKKTIGLAGLNQKELVAELRKLNAIKGSLTPFSKEFKDMAKEIKTVENRLYDVKNGVTGFSSMFSKITDSVKQFGVAAAAYLGFQFITQQFQSILQGAGRMSDQLADLQRVSGLTATEVDGLNKSFKELDTRTGTGALRDIAIVAGKLGVAKEDILGFTTELDKLTVALGDELGDADQISTSLGKILNVFDGEINADNISKLGNSLVVLANEGVATGGFIVDFTTRLAGLSGVANITKESAVGLAAGLEELGLRSESSTTSVIKVLGDIAADTKKFAEVANVSQDAFRKILKENPIEALIQVAEGFAKKGNGFESISKAFKEAGADGARVISTLGTLGKSADFVRGKIDLATESMKSTNAINDAFALKNETLGATLDKLGKEFNRLVTSSALVDFLKGAVEASLDFIAALKKIPEFIKSNKIALLTLVAGLILFNAKMIESALLTIRDAVAKQINAVATRLMATNTALATIAQQAYAVITGVLTGRIGLATAAQQLYNLAIGASAALIGGVVAVVAGLVLVLSAFIGKTKELTAAQTAQLDVQAKVSELTKQEETNARSLFNQITKGNLAYDEKKVLLAKLIALNPQYLNGLTLENIATSEGSKILDNYILKLKEVNRAKAVAKVIDDKEARVTELQNKIDDAYTVTKDASGKVISKDLRNKDGSFFGAVKSIFVDDEIATVNKQREELKKTQSELNSLYDEVKATVEKDIPKPGSALGDITPSGTDNKKAKKAKAAVDPIIKEMEAFEKELAALRKKAELNLLTDADRETKIISDKYQDLLVRARKFWQENSTIGREKTAEIIKLRDAELADLRKKLFEKGSEEEYAASLQASEDYFEQERNQIARNYAEGKINKEQQEKALTDIEIRESFNRIQIATDYSDSSKKAAEDKVKFVAAQEKNLTAQILAEFIKRTEFDKKEAAAALQLRILTGRSGSKELLKAKKDQLKAEFAANTEGLDVESQQFKLAKEKLRKDENDLDEENAKGKIQRALAYAQQGIDALRSINQVISNIEDRQLQKERNRNKLKADGYKKQLDAKLITQARYDKKISELQEEQAKKETELKRKQAKREKALNIFQSVVNTASAVTEALPNIPLSIAVGILGALQTLAIATQPLPEFGRGGMLSNGPKHSDKERGLHVVNPRTGKTEMLLERDEAVLNGRAMKSNRRMTISGTPSQIASGLNSSFGGKSWEGGARINYAPSWSRPIPQMASGFVRMMAAGGLLNSNSTASLGSNNEDIIAELRSLRQDINAFDKQKKSYVVFSEIQAANQTMAAAKRSGSIS